MKIHLENLSFSKTVNWPTVPTVGEEVCIGGTFFTVKKVVHAIDSKTIRVLILKS